MKKPAFIVTETLLSLVLAASVGTAALFTADIKTKGGIIPPEWRETLKLPAPASQTSQPAQTSAPAASSEGAGTSSTAAPTEPESAPEPAESSPAEESLPSALEALGLQVTEPKNLKAQPKELTKYISDYGYNYDYLGFDHLVLVDAGDNSQARVFCYQKSSKGYWWNIAGEGKSLTDKAFIGEKGADFDPQPGSKKTPFGCYRLGDGFYIGQKPDTTYPLFEITDDVYWVTDTKSKQYNQKVSGAAEKDWSSAHHMIDSKEAYRFGTVVEFNTDDPADKKLSSAIFLHCGSAPTDGSVVIPEQEMQAILEWLQSGSKAYLFVTP